MAHFFMFIYLNIILIIKIFRVILIMKRHHDMKCLECNEAFELGKQLSNHIKKLHKLSSEDYTIKYLYENKRPTCLECNANTRYVAFSFKDYCQLCSKIAMKAGGTKGGASQAWNKGKTKKDDSRIALQSLKSSGKNNPFFGKRHTLESLKMISSKKRISKDTFYARLEKRSDISVSLKYSSFLDRNEKNVECKCQSCKNEFVTSLSYLERDYKCPICQIRQPGFLGKMHKIETKEDIRKKILLDEDNFNKRIQQRTTEFRLLTSYEDYFSRQNQYLKFQCSKCNVVNEKTLQAFERGSLCQKCFPNTSSRAELALGDYIESLGFETKRNDRTVIKPKELDIIVDNKRAAFEYDGLYWHSDAGKPKQYHYDKTKNAADTGFKLFRIYSDQWEEKNDLIKAMIRCRLGIILKKIHARKCSVEVIDQTISKDFFNKNHLYGHSPSKISFGLIYNEEIVSVVSMRVPRQKKHRQSLSIEICRFASLQDSMIMGGFSKIFKRIKVWAANEGFMQVLTYADLDTGTGNVYEQAGFKFIGETGPSYWYSDGQKRFDRFKFRASGDKTERQIANDAGVVRIYGAGSKIFKYPLS